MRRKTKIVLAITFMVTAMVSAFSYLYISQLLRQRVNNASEIAQLLAQSVAYSARNAVPDLTSTRLDTDNPKAVRTAIEGILRTDTNLNDMVDSFVGNTNIVTDLAIVDLDGRAILHSNADLAGKVLRKRPDFETLRTARFPDQLRMIYSPASVYDVSVPLNLNGAPFGTVRVGISTWLFRSEDLSPRLRRAVVLSVSSIFLSLFLAALISRLALGPLAEISRNLDSVVEGGTDVLGEGESSHDEYGLVTLKIANLGRQMRDAKEIFSALKDNVDQLMANLQDGLMLFTRDSRVVLVSASVERFLGRPRGEMLGRPATEVFSSRSPLGAILLEAFERRRPILQREVESANGRRVQVSIDFIQEKSTQIGALVIMRDTESVRRLEDEIEMSRRLSASSRLTRGVAHEVKNPINAIVLHLHLLQNKLQQVDPGTRRHMDIIGSEIHRLDRVVQILVDFTRPRDLKVEEIDLRRLLEDVALLAAPDAEQHGVIIARSFPQQALNVKVDTDFMKQAILNIVINGVQAMTQGGKLTLTAHREEGMVLTEIRDTGGGIPKEVQEKIFELYFTTKKDGSGIGLAQTYQILQWHYGSVDFESLDGQGTTFRLRIPLAESSLDAMREVATRSQ
ncbi:MAG TPA: ATP-binding protein [Terriglobales bacterium]|jgi:PAS domain S-box-containing protein|nr:ATP-binding protein [Terriglobales bacterium]